MLQAAFRHRCAAAAKAAAAVWKRVAQFTGESRSYVYQWTTAQVCKRLVDEEACAVAQEAMAAALASEEAASRVVYYPPVKTGAWGGGLHGELLAEEVERVHGEGASARYSYSILVDDRETSAMRKQLVPLDAWPHRVESIAAGVPERARRRRSRGVAGRAARRQQKAALPLGTAAVAERPTRSGGRQRKLAKEVRQGLDWLVVRIGVQDSYTPMGGGGRAALRRSGFAYMEPGPEF